MICEYCGTHIPKRAVQCPACGAECVKSHSANPQQQTPAEPDRICVFCGALIPSDAGRRCPNCDMKVKCGCGEIIESPGAICPSCKRETQAYRCLDDYLEKKQNLLLLNIIQLFSLFILMGSACAISVLCVMHFNDKVSFVAFLLLDVLFTMIFGGIALGIYHWLGRVFTKAYIRKYQPLRQMLKEDDSFFQLKWQEYFAQRMMDKK